MVLGYLLSRYPQLSETFILREMAELRRQGHQLVIAPLLRAQPPRSHAATAALADAVAFEPWLSRRQVAWHCRQFAAAPAAYLRRAAQVVASHSGEANALAGAVLFWPKLGAIAARFRATGVEHIHAHFATHPALAAWVIHQWTGIPFSFTAHAHDIFAHRAGLGPTARAAALVITISDFNRRWLLDRCPGLAPGRVAVVHCGIRSAAYAQPPVAAADGQLRLLTVASLQPYKGHAVLLAACARLRGRLDYTLRLVGDGPLRAALARRIAELGIGGLVRLRGAATEDEVREELRRADVLVLPSVREPSGKMDGLPVALMEAMAAGLPVLAGDLAGIRELVQPEVNGLLFRPGDDAALAAAILRLRSPQRRSEWGRAGCAAIRREYELADTARQLAAHFAAAARPAGA